MNVWAPISFKAQPIILKLTDRLNESIKSSKICSMLMFLLMVQNGTSIFHELSSDITTATKRTLRCHISKHSMHGPAAHH
jgi:hypothetical protein